MNDHLSARLDDMVADRALVFSGPTRFFGAHTHDQVRPLLRQMYQATLKGRWAVGWVSYDATPAFLPEVRWPYPPTETELPLAGFWLTDEPMRTHALGGVSEGAHRVSDVRNHGTDDHAAAISRVQSAIEAGEIYQTNLTTTATGTLTGEVEGWYQRLGQLQQGRFHALLKYGDTSIVSASPERFFRWDDSGVLCSPMKGTAARLADPRADGEAREALLSSAKERAENIMITDLVRNDLSRIARTGTVTVTDLLRAEQFPTVWQLVTDIRADPRDGVATPEIFDALFPCGSITGAPKIRATELLSEIEPHGRGLYCGAIGYLAPPGEPIRAEFSVAIRTAVVNHRTDRFTYGVGGAITIDSVASAELAELRAKTKIIDASKPAPRADFALIETFGIGRVPLRTELAAINLDHHLARLARSAEHFGFVHDQELIRRSVLNRVERLLEPVRMRLLLTADGSIDITTADLSAASPEPIGVVVATRTPVPPGLVWSRHKTTHREHLEQALRAHPGAEDVVLVNTDGKLTESTIANLLVQFDGQWWTPPVADGCLPGVGRQLLLDAGEVRERSLTVADLRRARAIELVSSLRGRRQACLLN